MNKPVNITLVILFTAIVVLFIRQETPAENTSQTNNQPLLDALEKINNNINQLTQQINQTHNKQPVNNQQQWAKNINQASAEQQGEESTIVIPNEVIEPASVTQVMNAHTASRSVKSLQERPPMVVVNPTPEQNETFQTLKIQLDDPSYVSSLNLQTFSQSPEIANLPEPLQLVLITKAIKQYNEGNITKEVFLNN